MAELLIRVRAQDAALIERVLHGGNGRPDRVVVDAHVARAEPRIRDAARAAGIPLIVDPQTYYLQAARRAGTLSWGIPELTQSGPGARR